jgi:hypothetical protein
MLWLHFSCLEQLSVGDFGIRRSFFYISTGAARLVLCYSLTFSICGNATIGIVRAVGSILVVDYEEKASV